MKYFDVLKTIKIGPYKVETVQSNTATIEKGRLLDTVSFDRQYIAQREDEYKPVQAREENGGTGKNNVVHQVSTEHDTKEDEYIVKKIVGHPVKNGRFLYHVRWYEYSPDTDTDRLKDHVPNHFIRHYWKWQVRQGFSAN